ncbi:hypothetical protein [Pedobacter psychrodurus]|jgi:hypothetical protein|uniref:hypothetical protein n=1 Tax=Pedobacter psychrodurus TaxID=2530456 RepID=UPI00292D2470|nr:hypothetical protein [Pedobacter psychrodurus]
MHRGKILHEATKVYPSSIKEIVEAAGYKYGTFFKHIQIKDLSYAIIAKYGRAMRKDFSTEFPEMSNLVLPQITKHSDNLGSIDQIRLDLQELQAKYSALLEKHNSVIEELYSLKEQNRALKDKNH